MVMFKFLVYYAIPLFFIATFYIIMARHLVLSTKNMPGEAQGQGKQIQARKKVRRRRKFHDRFGETCLTVFNDQRPNEILPLTFPNPV